LQRLRPHRSSRNEEKPTQNQHDADHSRIDNGSATKRWRERKCKREERIGARALGKAQDPDPQNGQRGVENERNEKYPLSRKPAIRSASGPSPAPRSAGVLNSSWPQPWSLHRP
jgi:hypothetical protein